MMNEKLFRKDVNHKAPGWYLENGEISMFLTEEGGQHAPVTFFADSEKSVQPYYITPWQDRRPEELSSIKLLQNLRGDFFCLPFGGNAESYQGEQHLCHGETSGEKWTLTKAEKENGKTVFDVAPSYLSSKSPEDLRKRLL